LAVGAEVLPQGMARKLRVQYPGAIYHVLNRGDRREAIFVDDEDRRLFLETLGEACEKTDWEPHAWCLMSNHFHLVTETPRANLVAGIQWFLGVYTHRFNQRHREFGHLFSGRYKALLVESSGNGYLKTVCDYVHLNPMRAGLLAAQAPLQSYAWSSYPLYLQGPERRPGWLRVDRLLGEWGIAQDSPVGRQELLAQVSEQAGPRHTRADIRESGLAKAERIVQEELAQLGWRGEDLRRHRKGDGRKVRMAARLRRETTMTLAWIGQRLEMGAPGHVSCLLCRHSSGDQSSENKWF
jgi:REP element-mobilizing transposase RayT